jgi:cytokinin riboside 5'-monophosphate phosphoribohydrolase
MLNICVYCSAANNLNPAYIEAAQSIGRLIGERGHTLVYGGANRGLMGETARATKAAGGHVVGVIPQKLVDLEQAFEAADEKYITADLRDRKEILENRADAFVGLAGGLGTMDELFEIMTTRQLQMHRKAVVLVDTLGFYQPFARFIEHLYEQQMVKHTYKQIFTIVPDAKAAIDYLEAYQPFDIGSRF